MKLTLVAKRHETEDVMSFMFSSDAPLKWQAGQFLRYSLLHPDADDRGIARYFTIASAPVVPLQSWAETNPAATTTRITESPSDRRNVIALSFCET